MNCSWQEMEAYRYAEGSLDPQRRQAFADHLQHCETCRARVAEAERVERLLEPRLMRAPATLASRVAGAVAAEREAQRSRRPKLFSRRLSLALGGLALVLALSAISYAVAPAAVSALMRKVLFFVPGMGIEPVGDSTLVATGPVSVQSGTITFTVEALLSDGKQTTVKFELRGLPGGKEGWEPQRPGARNPVLRDGEGREYAMQMSASGVGGSPEENIVTGEMHFAPLPAGLESVDVVVPLELYVPPAAMAGLQQAELTAHVALVSPDESDLPAATPQSAEATVSGVTLKVTASSAEAGRTVVLVEGEAAGAARLMALGRMGGDPADAATLHDDRGREYRLEPQGSEVTFGADPMRRDLYFAPLGAGAGELTLVVPAVQVEEEGAVDVTIPLAGRSVGETFALDRTVDLGGYQVVLRSATLVTEQTPGSDPSPWLYVDVELPAGAGGRTLASFNAQRAGGSGATWSMGKGDGAQMDRLGVPVEPGEGEVTIHIARPVVVVEGPWELTFPAGQ